MLLNDFNINILNLSGQGGLAEYIFLLCIFY